MTQRSRTTRDSFARKPPAKSAPAKSAPAKSAPAKSVSAKSASQPKKVRRAQRPILTAKNADRHVLYQSSVQDPPTEVQIVERLFKSVRKRPPVRLREDFCGTGIMCAEWVRGHEERIAVGLDLDRKVLAWGQKHNIAPLGAAASRVSLRRQDVLVPTKERFDLILAFNYSYFVFKTRDLLRSYFEAARASLVNDGVFILDAYGGSESHEECETERREKGFIYIWDQAYFNPIDHHVKNYIHFRFRDGSELRRAFSYDWRLWSLPEITELLLEAGFSSADVYWEDEDEDGDGTGRFRKRKRADADAAFNAYLVAGR